MLWSLRKRKPRANLHTVGVPERTKHRTKFSSVWICCILLLLAVTAIIMLSTDRSERTGFEWRMRGTLGYMQSAIASGERHQATAEEMEYHRQLFQALVTERAIDREIILAVGTSDYKDLLLNLVCSFRHSNITNYVIGALDDFTFTEFKRMGLPVYSIYGLSALGGFEIRSGVLSSRNFNEANVVKHEAVIRALEMGYRVVSTDSDIVWLRNPLSYLRRAAGNDYDIVFQCDNALSDPKCNLCAGFYYANATTHAINAFKWLVSTKLENPLLRDQPPLRRFLCHKRLSNDTCLAVNSGPKIFLLPRTLFPAGYAVSEFGDNFDAETIRSWNPYILHFNWNDGGHSFKIKLMKKSGFWLLNSTNQCDIDN